MSYEISSALFYGIHVNYKDICTPNIAYMKTLWGEDEMDWSDDYDVDIAWHDLLCDSDNIAVEGFSTDPMYFKTYYVGIYLPNAPIAEVIECIEKEYNDIIEAIHGYAPNLEFDEKDIKLYPIGFVW